MAKSKRPSAKTGDTIDGDTIDGDAIDGDAIEKPVDQTAPPHASASKHSQTAPPPSGLSSGALIQRWFFDHICGLGLVEFWPIGLAGFAIWQATPEHSRYRRPYAS